MCWKRHRNLKEILLGDLSNKLLENVEDEIFSDKPCNCRRDKLVDGECFLNGQCRVSNVIYKLHCKCCGDSYLGKTARHTKLRAQEHINKVVEIWKKSETFNRLVAAEIEQTSVASPYLPPTSFQTPNRPTMVTRAMRGAATPPQTARSTPSTQSNAGLIAICQLFASQPPQTNNQLETLREDEEYSLAETSNPLPSEIVTTNHSMSDEPTSPVEEPTMETAEQPPTTLFREAFGTPAGNPRSNLQHLEQARPQLLAPVLDGHIKGIQCSNLTRHLWAHIRHKDFPNKEAVSAWCRANLRMEILFKGNPISLMKTASSKNCVLCMKERIHLFHHFGKKPTKTHNLMNSRKEMHGKCSCRTRFIRLRSCENESAEEATS